MIHFPTLTSHLDIAGFSKWLVARGFQPQPPANPWEVLRYKGDGVHIIYTNRRGAITWTGKSLSHYNKFFKQPQSIVPKNKTGRRRTVPKSSKKRKKIIERDGPCCWVCGEFLGDDQTLEHLVPKSEGGGNSLANLALAHRTCNQLVDNKPLTEKIDIRAAFLAKHETTPPWESVQ